MPPAMKSYPALLMPWLADSLQQARPAPDVACLISLLGAWNHFHFVPTDLRLTVDEQKNQLLQSESVCGCM